MAFGFVHAHFQLMQIRAQQFLQFGFDLSETAARLAYAADYSNQFRAGAFALHGVGTPGVFGENFVELGFVAALVGFIGFGHQLLALGAVFAIGGEVWMDALGDFAVELLDFRRSFERAGSGGGFFAGGGFRFVGASAGVLSGALGAVVRGLLFC